MAGGGGGEGHFLNSIFFFSQQLFVAAEGRIRPLLSGGPTHHPGGGIAWLVFVFQSV